MGYYVKNRVLQSGSTGVVLPTGTTAERPANAAAGLIRYNTTTERVEFYNGTAYDSLVPASTGSVSYTVENFTGDGATVTYTMTETPTAINTLIVFVGSLYQIPTTNYTVSGADITFDSAPPNDAPISIIHTNS